MLGKGGISGGGGKGTREDDRMYMAESHVFHRNKITNDSHYVYLISSSKTLKKLSLNYSLQNSMNRRKNEKHI